MRFEGLAHRIARLAAFKPDKIDDDAAADVRNRSSRAISRAASRCGERSGIGRAGCGVPVSTSINTAARSVGYARCRRLEVRARRQRCFDRGIEVDRPITQRDHGYIGARKRSATRHDRRIIRHEPIGHGRRPEANAAASPGGG